MALTSEENTRSRWSRVATGSRKVREDPPLRTPARAVYPFRMEESIGAERRELLARVRSMLLDWYDIHKRGADGRKPVVDRLWQIAAELARGPCPGQLNQALMELGATVCRPRSPVCPVCPLESLCDAARVGDAEALPIKSRKKPPRPVQAVAAWLERRGRVLVVQRPQGGLLGGMWELPGGAIEDGTGAEQALRRHLAQRLGLVVGHAERVGEIEHVFTHRRLRLHVFRCGPASGRVRRSDLPAHRWLSPAAIAKLPHGGPTRKALALLGHAHGTPSGPLPPRRRAR